MDICNPPLVWIGGSCYRKNPYMESSSDVDKVYSDTQDQYADDKYPPDDTKEFEDGNFYYIFLFCGMWSMVERICSSTNFD